MTSGISGVDMSTPVHPVATPLPRPLDRESDALPQHHDATNTDDFYVIRPKATEFGEITVPLGLIRRSRLFKVTDFGTNRKLIYDFLLVINSNLPSLLHRFWDIAVDRSKIAIFGYHSSV